MKRVFGILFVLLIALALGMSVGELREEGVSMRLACEKTHRLYTATAFSLCSPRGDVYSHPHPQEVRK